MSRIKISLQIGIDSFDKSRVDFNTSFSEEVIDNLFLTNILDKSMLSVLDSFIEEINLKQVEFGAVRNRLESALDEISVQYENLVSSRSTLRDADISEVSSEYIRQQILQQASATLMATANQSPSIALQLI